jgi:CBS-domain-containing membrane protein
MDSPEVPRRSARLTVADVMTRDVITVTPETPFKQLEQLMVEHNVSALPVVDSGGVAGIVSEADLLLKTEAEGSAHVGWSAGSRERDSKAHAQTAAGLMSSPALSVEPGAPLAAAARLDRKSVV